jgi:hypothetical protein
MNELAFMELLRVIQADVSIDEASKARIEKAAHQIGRRHGSKRMEVRERRKLAFDLLAQKLAPTVICVRLMSAYAISDRQAYRDIEAARDLCQNSSKNGRENIQTTTNEEVAE